MKHCDCIDITQRAIQADIELRENIEGFYYVLLNQTFTTNPCVIVKAETTYDRKLKNGNVVKKTSTVSLVALPVLRDEICTKQD